MTEMLVVAVAGVVRYVVVLEEQLAPRLEEETVDTKDTQDDLEDVLIHRRRVHEYRTELTGSSFLPA